jgi:hypothetical protein
VLDDCTLDPDPAFAFLVGLALESDKAKRSMAEITSRMYVMRGQS